MMRKRISVWMVALLALLIVAQPAGARKAAQPPPPPAAMDGTGSGDLSLLGSSTPGGTPGTWYLGAAPPNVDYTKPVLLFVHGKGSSAQTWWTATSYHGTNDMYTYAYNNGYRTAFVDLYPDQGMWDNGSMLNGLTDRIRSYFGVSKVTVIAHSKGGVDANAAAVHYGAAGKLSRIITLGSPHRGTPLADMAYSNWTWWLAELFGQTDEATYTMQTGYMDYFRSVTDGKISYPPYYTLSGYKCGPAFTAMWYGCMAISGEDDGVVPVWSTRIPGGTHLKEGYWDHDEIKMGSRTWSYFAPYIRTASTGMAVAQAGLVAAASGVSDVTPGAVRPAAPRNLILRGDRVAGSATATLPVESGVRSASFTLYTSNQAFAATLTGPDGEALRIAPAQQVPADLPLQGLWAGGVEVIAPTAGAWNLAVDGEGGYLLVVNLESDLTADLNVGHGIAVPGGKRDLTVTVAGRETGSAAVSGLVGPSRAPARLRPAFAGEQGRFHATVDLDGTNGIYNVSVTVIGITADGTSFERSLVSSFAAVQPQDIGKWR